jgi:hypothetical protein
LRHRHQTERLVVLYHLLQAIDQGRLELTPVTSFPPQHRRQNPPNSAISAFLRRHRHLIEPPGTPAHLPDILPFFFASWFALSSLSRPHPPQELAVGNALVGPSPGATLSWSAPPRRGGFASSRFLDSSATPARSPPTRGDHLFLERARHRAPGVHPRKVRQRGGHVSAGPHPSAARVRTPLGEKTPQPQICSLYI